MKVFSMIVAKPMMVMPMMFANIARSQRHVVKRCSCNGGSVVGGDRQSRRRGRKPDRNTLCDLHPALVVQAVIGANRIPLSLEPQPYLAGYVCKADAPRLRT